MKNSELQIVVISFSDDFTKNSESLITTHGAQHTREVNSSGILSFKAY